MWSGTKAMKTRHPTPNLKNLDPHQNVSARHPHKKPLNSSRWCCCHAFRGLLCLKINTTRMFTATSASQSSGKNSTTLSNASGASEQRISFVWEKKFNSKYLKKTGSAIDAHYLKQTSIWPWTRLSAESAWVPKVSCALQAAISTQI